MDVRCTLLAAALASLLAGCADSPASPSAPVASTNASIAGEWIGRYRETRCTPRLAGPTCSQRFKIGEPEFNFTLTFTQDGNRLAGTFDVEPRPLEAHAKGALSGVVNGTAVELSALLPWQDQLFPDVYGTQEVKQFLAVVDSSGLTMSGSFTMIHKDRDVENFTTESQILSLTKRQP